MNYMDLLTEDPEKFIKVISLGMMGIKKILNERLYDAYEGTLLHYTVILLITGKITDYHAYLVVDTIVRYGGDVLVEDCSGYTPYQLLRLSEFRSQMITFYLLLDKTTASVMERNSIKLYREYREKV